MRHYGRIGLYVKAKREKSLLPFFLFLEKRRCFVYDIITDGIVVYDDGFFEKIKSVYEGCICEFQMVREANGWRWKKPIVGLRTDESIGKVT